MRKLIFLTTLTLALSVGMIQAQISEPDLPANDPAYQAGADYSAGHRGDAVLVYRGGELVFEEYQNGYNGNRPHLLFSGTKSFSCAIAVAAVEDGLLTFDERVADTITEWASDPQRSTITVRQLLSLTSGLESGQDKLQGRAVDNKNLAALSLDLNYPPGERFQYGPSNFYVFSEMMERKLGGEAVLDYLRRRVLDPVGLDIGRFAWGVDADGNPNLAAGAALTARSWARYGQLILQGGMWNGQPILRADLLNQCFIGTYANPYYGLTFWLYYAGGTDVNLQRMTVISPRPGQIPDGVVLGETMPEIITAAGANNQRMYIIRSLDLVIVRFGQDDSTWDDHEFLTRLLSL